MPNLSELNPASKRRIMIYGDVGAGKTVFIASWPGKIHFCDFDGKVSSAAAFHKGNADLLTRISYDEFRHDKPYERFHNWLLSMSELAAKGAFPYDVVAVDSITEMLNVALGDFMLKNSAIQRTRTTVGTIASMLDYRALEVQMRDVFRRLFALPCHIIAAGHIRTKQDESTGQIFTGPEGPASVIKHLQIIFEEVYRLYTDGEGDKRKYMMQTQASARYPARSQIRGMPATVETSYESIRKFGG